MEINVYTVGELEAELNHKDFWFQNVAPITRHRARFVINNPRSERDDAVLFVAKDEEEIIGYRLVFPDKIFVNEQSIKIGWGSSFWVSEKYRGKGVGKALFRKSSECWKGSIGSLIQSSDATRVYERDEDFYCFNQSIGFQFIIRANASYWIKKKLKLPGIILSLLSILNVVPNLVINVLKDRWRLRRKTLDEYALEYCTEITDVETRDFIRSHNQNSLSRKEVADLNAIVRYPTSLATPLEDTIGKRYYFSTKADRYEYLYLKVYKENNELVAVMLMNVEGAGLKLLYYFTKSERFVKPVFDILLLHAIKMKTEIITSYDPRFVDYMVKSSGFPTLLKRKQPRKSFLNKQLWTFEIGGYLIYDGDGA
jgi:GNAT superfamily N-acetyltransferase